MPAALSDVFVAAADDDDGSPVINGNPIKGTTHNIRENISCRIEACNQSAGKWENRKNKIQEPGRRFFVFVSIMDGFIELFEDLLMDKCAFECGCPLAQLVSKDFAFYDFLLNEI